jgi:hypothetical protein
MKMGELEDLRSEIATLTTDADEAEIPPEAVWSFISNVIGSQPVNCYYVSPMVDPSYDAIANPKVQVLVVTNRLVYDFVFSASTARYDIAPLSLITRIDERREIETSIEGPPRAKVIVRVEFAHQTAVLHPVSFGDKGRQLSEFAQRLRTLAFGE